MSFWIEVDSLDFTTRAVLSQKSKTGSKWHPVVFFSKSLTPIECNYEVHDKEMLAIIHALEKWWHFLEEAENLNRLPESGVLHDG